MGSGWAENGLKLGRKNPRMVQVTPKDGTDCAHGCPLYAHGCPLYAHATAILPAGQEEFTRPGKKRRPYGRPMERKNRHWAKAKGRHPVPATVANGHRMPQATCSRYLPVTCETKQPAAIRARQEGKGSPPGGLPFPLFFYGMWIPAQLLFFCWR